jgi:hypothetical protein
MTQRAVSLLLLLLLLLLYHRCCCRCGWLVAARQGGDVQKRSRISRRYGCRLAGTLL